MSKNIVYRTRQITDYYKSNRSAWKDFYPSERFIFEKLISDCGGTLGNMLDVGCAVGGLGAALSQKGVIASYTGIDINKSAIKYAQSKNMISVPHKFIAGDILTMDLKERYDTVVSLSCADWNIETDRVIRACWQRVKDDGYFVISLRLTDKEGTNNLRDSYQYIDFFGKEENPEVANYVVFNFYDAIRMFKSLDPVPMLVGAYGYWGKPSQTAVTPYERLLFTVFYIKKGFKIANFDTKAELFLPADIITNTVSESKKVRIA